MYIKEHAFGTIKSISVKPSEKARWTASVRIMDGGKIYIEWNRPPLLEHHLMFDGDDSEALATLEDAKGFLKALEKAIEIAEAIETQNGQDTNK